MLNQVVTSVGTGTDKSAKKAMRLLLSSVFQETENETDSGFKSEAKGKPLIECVYDFVKVQPAGCTIFYIVKNQESLQYGKRPTFASISSSLSLLKKAGIVEVSKNKDQSSTFKVVAEYSKDRAYTSKKGVSRRVPNYAHLDTKFFIVIRSVVPVSLADWSDQGPTYRHLIHFSESDGPMFESEDVCEHNTVIVISNEASALRLYDQIIKWYAEHNLETPTGLRIAYAG